MIKTSCSKFSGTITALTVILAAVLSGGLLAGCEPVQPYRTVNPDPNQVCDPDVRYNVAEECRANLHEHSKDYDLFFTEFTDQGLQYASEQYPEAGFQINKTIEGLKSIANQDGVKGISVITFVHGWKHNARHDDENVSSFRALLRSTASIEEALNSGYRVVGVYVGWRGLSISPEPFSELSFWSRKATALRVAQGSPRELFNRLRSFKCAQNLQAARVKDPAGNHDSCTDLVSNGPQLPKVRMMMIGHSFGGWILYNAMAGSLIESLTYEGDTEQLDTVNLRFADMIVLLNPAFEASRYTPLHRIATTRSHYPRYQAPLLVSVTTSADWATGLAFPAGRFVNSLFERATNEEENDAITHTMGHMPKYITHELHNDENQPSECAKWKPLYKITNPEERSQQVKNNLDSETANTNNFPGTRQKLDTGWQRTFCGGAKLTHEQHDPNSIIWNVRTDSSIMTGHNNITNPLLTDFIRQLYRDTILYPSINSNVAPAMSLQVEQK
jgi:hypothetical protein